MMLLDEDRLFPPDPRTRDLARALYGAVRDLPIVSPHGHTDPRWYAENQPFPDPAQLFVTPDHYVFRMLASQGVALTDLGVPRVDGGPTETDGRKIWRLFASHYHLFAGTPSRLWLDHSFQHVFGIDRRLSADTADWYYDHIADCLSRPEFRPRALFERFNIEVIATTEAATDDLRWHRMIRESGWTGRVVTAYRPDGVVDPEMAGFAENVALMGQQTGFDTATWAGYLDAHRARRAQQRSEIAVPPHRRFGAVLAARLAPYRRDGGLADPDALAHAVTVDEAMRCGIATGTPIPLPVLRRLRRCRSAR